MLPRLLYNTLLARRLSLFKKWHIVFPESLIDLWGQPLTMQAA